MSAVNVQKLCESAQEKLKNAVKRVEIFLNEHALPQLAVDGNEESVLFYKGFLSDLRHVLVFSEVSYEKLGVALRRANFDVDFAEKALYNVYHDCVNSFFYPKNESYAEDGRYAYTGQDAIRFRKTPVPAAREVIMDITKNFEELRDDLTYYESDYLTQRRMQTRRTHA
ncbi:YpuI family protein [Paenibacillus sp. CMAA1739]|uniref:YpuI family protein n=1 Tax=Paenibacillus ottowii TaxID=2315729 RepID=UPI00272FE665|nr:MULTISPECIES: YpuI family protein [Paenibacillus]MDP1509055.1 YpuI family protein [Paenibacillus ottowii]MEC4564821.1 YpuI family protein [Paenibacillus sp. CMAA1739]